MLLHWIITYLDSKEKSYKRRELFLDTNSLDAKTKATVEAVYELGQSNKDGMLKFKHLFVERSYADDELEKMAVDGYGGVYISGDYLEDESGNRISVTQAARVITGNPDLVLVPASFSKHDIEFMQSDRKPIPIDQLNWSADDIESLAYFVRDLRALESTAFMREGPGQLQGFMSSGAAIITSTTEDEISAFIAIFRRLFMHKDPHNFRRTVELFAKCVGDYPHVRWVQGEYKEYAEQLNQRPDSMPFAGANKWTFSRKDLLDVFIGSRYAHQPNKGIKAKYAKYLEEFGGQTSSFTYLFLTEVHNLALKIKCAGRIIANVFDLYCQCHAVAPAILGTLASENPGIGSAETKDQQRQHILDSKIDQLALALWKSRNCPDGGFEQFRDEARDSLKDVD